MPSIIDDNGGSSRSSGGRSGKFRRGLTKNQAAKLMKHMSVKRSKSSNYFVNGVFQENVREDIKYTVILLLDRRAQDLQKFILNTYDNKMNLPELSFRYFSVGAKVQHKVILGDVVVDIFMALFKCNLVLSTKVENYIPFLFNTQKGIDNSFVLTPQNLGGVFPQDDITPPAITAVSGQPTFDPSITIWTESVQASNKQTNLTTSYIRRGSDRFIDVQGAIPFPNVLAFISIYNTKYAYDLIDMPKSNKYKLYTTFNGSYKIHQQW